MMNNISYEEALKKRRLNDKKRIDAIRNSFKNSIKETFLIKIYNKIREKTNEYKDIVKYYPNISINDINNLLYIPVEIDIDVCSHIIGIHTYNSIFLDDNERAKKQNDNAYIEELIDRVLLHIKLRRFGSKTIRVEKYFGRDNFMFLTPVYNLYNASTFLIHLLTREIDDNNLLVNTAMILAKKSIAVLALIDYNNLENAYPILRSAIEVLISYLAICDNPSAQKEYALFNEYKLTYANYGKFDEGFLKKYNEIKNKYIKEIDYLNNGWFDSIFEANYTNTNKTFKFYDVMNFVNEKYSKTFNDNSISYLISAFQKSHILTHGNIILIADPIDTLFDIVITMSMIIEKVYQIINQKYGTHLYYDIDISRLMSDSLHSLYDSKRKSNGKKN